MGKMFYSFDDRQMYVLHRRCSLDTLMKEQRTRNGILVRYDKEVFETVEYIDGKPVEFLTKVISDDEILQIKQVIESTDYRETVLW